MAFSLDISYYRWLNFCNIKIQREYTFLVVDKKSWFVKRLIVQYYSVQLLDVDSDDLTCLNITF